MPVDLTALDNAIAALTTEVTADETTDASAVTLINGFSASIAAAVTAALQADNAATATSIQAANDAITAVTARYVAAGTALGAAVQANTPVAPTQA
jgi:hypothetical protein